MDENAWKATLPGDSLRISGASGPSERITGIRNPRLAALLPHVTAMPGIVRRIETSGQTAPAIAFAPLFERCSCAGDAWNSAWTKTPGKLRFPEIP